MTVDDFSLLPPRTQTGPYPRPKWVRLSRWLVLFLSGTIVPLYVFLLFQAAGRGTLLTTEHGLLDPVLVALAVLLTLGGAWAAFDTWREDTAHNRQRKAERGVSFFILAEQRWREYLTEARANHDRVGELRGLTGVGHWLTEQKRYAEAEPVLNESLTLARKMGNRVQEERVLTDLAQCAHARGDMASAERLYRECLAVTLTLTEADMPQYPIGALEEAATAYEDLGRMLIEQPDKRMEGCQMLERAEARVRVWAKRARYRDQRRYLAEHADELRDLRRSLSDESDAGEIG